MAYETSWGCQQVCIRLVPGQLTEAFSCDGDDGIEAGNGAEVSTTQLSVHDPRVWVKSNLHAIQRQLHQHRQAKRIHGNKLLLLHLTPDIRERQSTISRKRIN